MMKSKILFLIMSLALAIVGLSGCKDDTSAGLTRITYFPTLDVLGDPLIVVNKGTNFVDPGCHAVLNGKDVTNTVEIKSNVDTKKGGVYSISYKVTNEDGFSVTGSRTVWVQDTTPSIIANGKHKVLAGTYRINKNSGAKTSYSGYNITIFQTEPGVFYVTDFLGGYYDQRAGYGPSYGMTGYFKLNPDNTLTLQSSFVAGWGDSLNSLTKATIDPATGQIMWSALYAGYLEFNVILN